MPKVIGTRPSGGAGQIFQVQRDDGSTVDVADFGLPANLRRDYEQSQRAAADAAAKAQAEAEKQRMVLEGPSPTELGNMSVEDGKAAVEAARLRREQSGAAPEAAVSLPPEQMVSTQPTTQPAAFQPPLANQPGSLMGAAQQVTTGVEPETSLRATAAPRPSGGGGTGMLGLTELRKGAELKTKGLEAMTEASIAEKQAEGIALAGKKAEMEAMDAAEAARQARVQAARDEQMNKLQRMTDALSKEEGGISTSRWWSSRTSGQKVLAGMSAFLSGFSGTMSPVFKFIDDDIAAQKEDLARRLEGKKSALAAQTSLLSIMRANGMDDAEAAQGARAAYLQRVGVEMDRLAANSQDPKIRANLEIGKGQLQTELGKDLAELGDKFANRQIQREGLDIQRGNLMLEAQKAGAKGEAGQKVTAGEAAKVGELEAGLGLLEKLRGDWKKDTGFASALTQFIPGTDASKFNDKRKVATQIIGGILEGGKLTDPDYERYLAMMPEPSDSNERAEQKLRAIEASLRIKRRATIGGLTQAGFNTSGFTPSFTESAPPPARK